MMAANGHFSYDSTLNLYSPKFYNMTLNIRKFLDKDIIQLVKYYTIVILDIVDMVQKHLKKY